MKVLATLNLLVLALLLGSLIVEAHDVRGDERSNNLRTRTETARTTSHHHETRSNVPEARSRSNEQHLLEGRGYEELYAKRGLKCTNLLADWKDTKNGWPCEKYNSDTCKHLTNAGTGGYTNKNACCACGGGNMEKIDGSPIVFPSTELAPTDASCSDDLGWKDSKGRKCVLFDSALCTSKKDLKGVDGVSLREACCWSCKKEPPSINLDIKKNTLDSNVDASCVDDPDWKDLNGRGCSSFDSLKCQIYEPTGLLLHPVPITKVCCESCKKKPTYNFSALNMKPEAMRAGHHKRSRTSDKNFEARGYENVEGRSCVDYDGWKETNYGSNCTWYDPKTNTDACREYASDVLTDNKNVTEACCVCGGGSTGGSVSTSTANAAHPVAVTASTVAPGAAGGDAAKWVEAHNKRRKKYSKEWGYEYQAVGWNEDLAAQAQAWADHLIAKECGNIPHLTKKCRTEGENNAQEQSDPRPPVKNIDGVLTAWTEEEIAGDPAMADHASQVLWKDTTAIGCGYATGTCSNGWETAVQVCRYFPGGNLNCGGPCIDAVKKNIMPVDNTKPMKSTSDMHKCLKKEEEIYGK
ncbi:unnamed protein product [Cylindrotheca closterium]|uniref:SCP domain-containing protein n=1 Tax=Cylindrotheca closterium TaxID=2856 RepID=A0AAD2CUY8_9STRA|nr:unnamed protein product [Cylindrotheca closterium]